MTKQSTFSTWEDLFSRFGSFKSVEAMKSFAKQTYQKSGGAMAYSVGGGVSHKCVIPNSELEKL